MKYTSSNINESSNFINLSGPVTAHSTVYLGKKYYFFGDSHFSLDNTCSTTCIDYDMDTLEIVNQSKNTKIPCHDITVLTDNIIKNNETTNKYVDVYVEIPLYKVDQFSSDEEIKDEINEVGYLQKIFYIYQNCFNETNCSYKNSRFHYIDIRLNPDLEYSSIYPFLLDELYGTSRIIVESSGKKEDSDQIKLIDKLVDVIFNHTNTNIKFTKNQPIIIQLFNLYLTSDDFENDAFELFEYVLYLYYIIQS